MEPFNDSLLSLPTHHELAPEDFFLLSPTQSVSRRAPQAPCNGTTQGALRSKLSKGPG